MVARCVCVSHILGLGDDNYNYSPKFRTLLFAKKEKEKFTIYIYLYIYIVLPILPLSPQNAPAENRTVIVIVIARAFFEVHNLRCTPQLSSEKKYRKTLANPE